MPRRLILALASLCIGLIAFARADEPRSIALILDASGSMNAKLPSSGTRIEAAKAAVSAFVGKLAPDTRIAYRVYGHQSPTRDRNCKDTELMVGFGRNRQGGRVDEPVALERRAAGGVLNAAAAGHAVLDWETGVVLGKISSFKRRLTVLPSTFTVTFGGAAWRQIEVKTGEHKVLNPAVIAVKGASARGHRVHAEDGTLVAKISNLASVLPVPPGKYTIEAGNQKLPLDLAEGQRMEIDLK